MVDDEKDPFEEVEEECEDHEWNSKFNRVDGNGYGNGKNGNGNDGNSDVIELELGPKLKESRIVTSFVLYTGKKTIELLLNHKYESKTVIFPVDIDNWTEFTNGFETRLKKKGIGQERCLPTVLMRIGRRFLIYCIKIMRKLRPHFGRG